MNLIKISSVILSFASTLFLISCAGQGAPEGGPVDAIPPEIVRTEPDTNAVHVKTDKIVLEFSEYVERRSVEESIFISPYLGELEFDWSGREVTISFTEPLRDHTTYVMNVGTDVIDVRARNRLASGFTLAFSTGDSIDRGMIRGKVFDDKPEGIMMFAYSLDRINSDTLDPSKTKPDYIVQTGKGGLFALSNLGWGNYRVIAVRDEYKNLLYDKQIDQFGVSIRDIVITKEKPLAEDVWFRMASEDTTKPFLSKVQATGSTVLHLRFSEPVDSASFATAGIALRDTLGYSSVPVALRSLDRSDSTSAIIIMSAALDSSKGYRVTLAGVADYAGNMIDSSGGVYAFSFNGKIDTTRPGVSLVGIQDSAREISQSEALEIRFTEPVNQSGVTSAITLIDSSMKPVATKFSWWTLTSIRVTPLNPLEPNAWYLFRVVMDSIADLSGNRYRDSVMSVRFQTFDPRTTGTLEGYVVDSDSSLNRGDIVLTATRILSSPVVRSITLQEPGKFKFDRLPEGRYTMSAFRDRDSSHSYSFGRPFPFEPSERFAAYSDTIKVRARWGVEGINVVFKRRK
jgi:hypothetical protein